MNWADVNPPTPAIVVGQAPDNGAGQSWGGYPGWEEFKGVIRGMQFYSYRLTDAQKGFVGSLQTDAEVLAACAANSMTIPWYLNMNPTPSDVTDKSGNGHHGAWHGTARPTLWQG